MTDMKLIQQEAADKILQGDLIKETKEFASPESLYDELIASVRRYHPFFD